VALSYLFRFLLYTFCTWNNNLLTRISNIVLIQDDDEFRWNLHYNGESVFSKVPLFDFDKKQSAKYQQRQMETKSAYKNKIFLLLCQVLRTSVKNSYSNGYGIH